MLICLFEDDVRTLEPLTLTRPAFELRCGQTTLCEKQVQHFGATSLYAWMRRDLTNFYYKSDPERRAWQPMIPARCAAWPRWYVNARWLPPVQPTELPEHSCIGLVDEEVAYAFIDQEAAATSSDVHETLHHWQRTLPQRAAGGLLVKYPWELVDQNANQIVLDFEQAARADSVPEQVTVVGPRALLAIAPTAQLDPLVVFDTRNGPIIVEAGAVVTAFSRIEGPCVIGAGAQVLGAKIRAGTTIGPQCRVGGEIEASILHAHSNKYHDGFLGHSYIGEWVNLGAGTNNSDLRNDYGPVRVPLGGVPTSTGLTKVGCFIGDHTKTGLGTLLNTGTCIGAFCSVLPSGGYAPKWLPSFTAWWNGALREEAEVSQLLQTASVVMSRRGQTLTEGHATFYQRMFEQTAVERGRALREQDQRQLRRSA